MVDYYQHNEEEYKNYIKKYHPGHPQLAATLGLLIEKFKKIKFKTVFEVGCGYGYMAKVIVEEFEPSTYIGIDLSIDQIVAGSKYLNGVGVSLIHGDIINYAPIKRYDLVFCSTVLSHIPLQYIGKAVGKVCKLSKRHVVIVEPTNEVISRLNRNDDQWLHDYRPLFGRRGWIIRDKEKVEGFPLLYMRFGRR